MSDESIRAMLAREAEEVERLAEEQERVTGVPRQRLPLDQQLESDNTNRCPVCNQTLGVLGWEELSVVPSDSD